MLEALPVLASTGEEFASRATSWLDAHPLSRGELHVAQSRERLGINLAFKRRIAGQLGTQLRAAGGRGAR
jgi:hypothetical protein